MYLVANILLSASVLFNEAYEAGKKSGLEHIKLEKNEKQALKDSLVNIKNTRPIDDVAEHAILKKQDKCVLNASSLKDQDTNLYVFVSFSLPLETWISLSKEVQKVGGILVLRGLPQNSFKELAMRLDALRKVGVFATIQLDPLLFTKFSVDHVPAFVAVTKSGYDKLSGNVSLSYALGKMENETATVLRGRL